MDTNGLRSFGLSYGGGLQPWPVPAAEGVPVIGVEPALGHRITGVRLASRGEVLALTEEASGVDALVLRSAMAVDAIGNHVRWDGAGLSAVSHLAARHGLAPRAFELPAQAQPVTDMTLGDDDVLYLAGNGALWMVDLRGRFELARLAAPAGFKPQRLASRPGGGVWALDVEQGAVARASGLPRFTHPLYLGRDSHERIESCDPNPMPPTWHVAAGRVPANEKAVAIATHRHGKLLVMSLLRAAGGVQLRLLLDDGRLSLPLRLSGTRFAHTLGWLDGERIAIATRGTFAPRAHSQISDPGAPPPRALKPRDPGVWTYAMPVALLQRLVAASGERETALPPDLAAPLLPEGEYYPLRGWTGGPFANGRPGQRLSYPRQGSAGEEPARLARVSGAARARYGLVANFMQGAAPGTGALPALGLLDTRESGTVWHRLYAEAAIPTGCAMIVWLAAGESLAPAFGAGPMEQREGWYPHLIGERAALPAQVAAALPDGTPRAAWVEDPTEVPHGQSVLCAQRESTPRKGRVGLFTVLVQRAGLCVRALQGARLWVVVELFGDGRATPELAALRAYAGRVSYRDRYLPALYHERSFGQDAEAPGRATGADFLDRYLNLFEGLFTDIEGRIAASALMTDAMACPPEALDWLAAWLGLALEPGLAPERARWMLANAAELANRHGTLAGLQLALDIATGGAVARGRIVVVEDFRLRRSLSTILGAQLEDADDPLTAGISQSGNSVVGDTLFLGEARTRDDGQRKAFLTLFRRLDADTAAAQALLDADRSAARKALFDDLAHRATILVHEDSGPEELRLVQRLSELGAPAHVLVRVTRAAYPFMVGVASLVGADTYLRAAPVERAFRVGPGDGTSSLGGVDTLRGEASLDAHAGAFAGVLPPVGTQALPPIARVATVGIADSGISDTTTPFALDGSASSADTGHTVTTFTWSHFPPD